LSREECKAGEIFRVNAIAPTGEAAFAADPLVYR
jgi:hypothetical protein